MENGDLARALSARLGLERPPVGVAFADAAPAGVEPFDAAVPSACSFWPRAESRTFYASAEQHLNCPIGAMTMGFELPPATASELSALVERMAGAGYLDADEPPSIPAVERRPAGIVYGPLATLPVEPDVILLWLSPAQAMLYNEASGGARWADRMPPTTFGRPTCAALPAALAERRPALSLGCIGMRTYTGVDEATMLAAVPGGEGERFAEALAGAAAANERVRPLYEENRRRFA